jgi:hypothetical protein
MEEGWKTHAITTATGVVITAQLHHLVVGGFLALAGGRLLLVLVIGGIPAR